MKQLIVFFGMTGLFMLMLAGCKSSQPAQHDTIIRDSISYVERYHTDTVSIPGDTLTLTAWIECDSITNKPKPVNSRSGSSRGSASITIDANGRLQADVILNLYKAQVQRLTKELYRAQQEKELIIEVKTEYKTRRIDIFCRWVAGFSLLIFALYTLKKNYFR